MISFKKNIYLYTSLALLICFCICHFAFSYHSRLESDDYNLIGYLNNKGFFGTIKFIYLSWEGAFGVLVISLLKIKFALLFNSILIHDIVSTVITFYCFYYFIKTILAQYLAITENHYPFILTILIYVNLYYNDLAINDTWYWLCGSVYFFMPILLLFFIAVLINNTNKFLVILAYVYFFLYGASRLNYAVILLSVLGIMFLYYWFKKKTFNKTIFLLCVLVLSSLIIYVIAPGNYIRRNEELKQVLTLGDYIVGPLKMCFWFIYRYIILKLPYHILFMLPALFIGYLLKEKIEAVLPSKKHVLKFITWIFVFCFFCIYMQSLSMFIAKGGQMPRTLVMVSVITALCMLAVFIIIGSKIEARKTLLTVSIVCSLIASLFLLRRIYICYPIIKKYSAAVDERHRTIENAIMNFKGDTLVLKNLPPASWLHSGELKKRAGNDPMNNVFLESYYQPPFLLDVED